MRPAEVRGIRLRLRMTQAEFAVALGYNDDRGNADRIVHAWESGRRAVPVRVGLAVQGLVAAKVKGSKRSPRAKRKPT